MDNEGNTWLAQKIKEVQESAPEKTICIVAHQSELKDGHLYDILPAGVYGCKDFRQDLNMDGAYWFYTSKRMLLVQKTKDEEGAKDEAIRKSYRALGVTACTALQAKKISEV